MLNDNYLFNLSFKKQSNITTYHPEHKIKRKMKQNSRSRVRGDFIMIQYQIFLVKINSCKFVPLFSEFSFQFYKFKGFFSFIGLLMEKKN